jgi:regulator of nucleoside diphosphate kinase
MSDDTPCHLTAKDVSVLEAMMDRPEAMASPAIARLLRRKLASARVCIRDDIDPRVATINSRIQYAVGSGPAETCVLTHGGERALPGTALPISGLHGLALLGLMEGDAIAVDMGNGGTNVLRLVRIEHQPEAARRRFGRPRLAVIAGVGIQSRRSDDNPEDDDPGPRAA